MKIGYQYLLAGFLFLLFSLINYLLIISPPAILFLGVSVVLFITGILEIRKYYNKILYLALIIVVASIMLVIYREVLVNPTDLSSYFLGVIFTLFIFWPAYYFIRKIRNYKELIENYDKKLKLDPGNTTLLNNKGTSLVGIDEYKEAIKCFDTVLKIDPRDAAAWHNKGVMFEKIKKNREAIKYYDKALEIDPKFEIAKNQGKIILEN
jgi:tetratricopeptide (TPR) repeat protein